MSYFARETWDFSPPPPSQLGDHSVRAVSQKLAGRSIALMVCGGIAAMKAPLLARALRKAGAEVTAFVSQEALRYVAQDALAWSCDREVIIDLSARAEHLGDGQHFDAYLVAPATYNTINKAAHGIADSLITTTLASAIGRCEQGMSQVLIVPTMHGSMHNSILSDSLKRLAQSSVHIVKPRMDYGKHNIPSEETLVNELSRAISKSPLKGKGILLTGGPTPVHIDGVRRLTNKFTGRLAHKILEELYTRGAEVRLLLGAGSHSPPSEFNHLVEWVDCFDTYHQRCLTYAQDVQCWAGIFTAAVADYQPIVKTQGKIESGRQCFSIDLQPTIKVIDELRQQCPQLNMMTFKYQENMSHEALMEIADERLNRFEAVIANRGEEQGSLGEQVAWLCTKEQSPKRLSSKLGIASGIADYLENLALQQA